MDLSTLLEVKDLRVETIGNEPSRIIENISFQVNVGEMMAIVGESGSGKSMTALSIMGLLPEALTQASGEINYEGADLTKLSEKKLNNIRGNDISMIFQEPMTSLNPSFTIGNQIYEIFKQHTNYTAREIKERSVELLSRVKIPDPKEKLNAYPHELSGGMRQRVMIAMALVCNPKILIADEPTTALDVTIQAQILDLLAELQKSYGMTVIIITHDLGVVAETCQRAIVMYAGQIVEEGTVKELFSHPQHPYTRGLMLSMPKIGKPKEKLYVIKGVVPDISRMPSGCRFNPRCEYVTDYCQKNEPKLERVGLERRVRCWNSL
jgi:oligopeptide/dipeptide ABC transporter ATP-binding protein